MPNCGVYSPVTGTRGGSEGGGGTGLLLPYTSGPLAGGGGGPDGVRWGSPGTGRDCAGSGGAYDGAESGGAGGAVGGREGALLGTCEPIKGIAGGTL